MRKLIGLQTCQKEIRDRKSRQSSLLSVHQFLNDDKLEQVDPDEKDDPLLMRLISGKKDVGTDFDQATINQHLISFDAILDKAAQEAINKRCSVSQILKQSQNQGEMAPVIDTDTTILDMQKLSLKPGAVVAGLKQELSKANSFFKKKQGRDMNATEKKQFEQMWNQQYEMVMDGSLLRKDQQLTTAKVLQMASVERMSPPPAHPPPISGMLEYALPEIPLSYALPTIVKPTVVKPTVVEEPKLKVKVEFETISMGPPPNRRKFAVERSESKKKKDKPLHEVEAEMKETAALWKKQCARDATKPTSGKWCIKHQMSADDCPMCKLGF